MSVPIRRLKGLAETCVFSKQSPRPLYCDSCQLRTRSPSPTMEHPFSRSYGVNLPSSLTRVISSTLGYSPHLPVSVYGTVRISTNIEVFLGSMIRGSWFVRRLIPSSPLGVMRRWICLPSPPTGLNQHNHSLAALSLLRHPIVQTH